MHLLLRGKAQTLSRSRWTYRIQATLPRPTSAQAPCQEHLADLHVFPLVVLAHCVDDAEFVLCVLQ